MTINKIFQYEMYCTEMPSISRKELDFGTVTVIGRFRNICTSFCTYGERTHLRCGCYIMCMGMAERSLAHRQEKGKPHEYRPPIHGANVQTLTQFTVEVVSGLTKSFDLGETQRNAKLLADGEKSFAFVRTDPLYPCSPSI